MNSNIETLKNIPILDVLGKLGYHKGTHYVIQGDKIRMKDSKGKISDGWIGSISKNRMYAHSGLKEGRFEGDTVGVVRGALNLDAGGACSWLEDSFNIKKVKMEKLENSLSSKWDSASELTPEQIKYLESRGIEYNEHIRKNFRNYNGAIATPIRSENGYIKAIQGRKGEEVDKKYRYQIEKEGEDGTGLFTYLPKPDTKTCFVVEGMTDFGTLTQAGVNVIGIVSATTGIQYLKSFDRKYDLVFIPDNDESGIKSIEAFDNNHIKYTKYDLNNFGDDVNDVNDAWNISRGMGVDLNGFLSEIYDGRDKPLSNIELAIKDGLEKRSDGYKTGEGTFDWATGGIVPGTTYLINGPSSQGKTTWAMWILMKMMKHDVKIGFFSMETRPGKMLAQIIGYHLGLNWKKEIMPNFKHYVEKFGIKRLEGKVYLYNDRKTISSIEEAIRDENLDIAFIDYAQLVRGLPGKDMKAKMDEYSWQIQQVAQDTQCATITLSQVTKSEWNVPVITRTPKEAGALMEASDTMINVGKYNGKHKVAFIKSKEGDDDAWYTEHDTDWDKKTGEISIFRSFSDEGVI